MSIARSLEISASGLTAERLRMDVISNNLANVNTTIGKNGQPYRRQHVVFAADEGSGLNFAAALHSANGGHLSETSAGGVKVVAVEDDRGDFKRVPDPDSPTGYKLLPNVEPV